LDGDFLLIGGDSFIAIRKILVVQASVLIVVPALMLVFFGWAAARSGFLGALTGFVPSLCFALRIVATKAKSAKHTVRAFYSGEAMKIAITAGLFVCVFQLPNILYGPLFAGFAAVISVFWFALLFSRTESDSRNVNRSS
jgi:ATP synthase protein I